MKVNATIPVNTPDWVVTHARAQQRLFRWGERVHTAVPKPWRMCAASAVARHLSPELNLAEKIWSGLQQFTGCNDAQAHQHLARWYANQGAFAVELHDYPRLDARWASQDVLCPGQERSVLAAIRAKGGLVITCHSHHHNRLGAFLGLSGTRVWGIAGPEEGSLWQPWTARYVRAINGGSEALFGGGRYLFIDDMRTLLRESRAALQRGDTVVNLADGPQDSPTAIAVDLAGRHLHMASALIELALELEAPIYFAQFFSDLQNRHVCRLVQAQRPARTAAIAHEYAAHLMRWCADHPYAWQGWMWWDDLPFAGAQDAALMQQRASAAARFAASHPRASWAERALQALAAIELRLAPPRP